MKKEPKILNIMRISAFLLFLCIFTSFAETTHSQNAKVNIHRTDMTIGEFIDQVEQQTDYLFVYSKNELNTENVLALNSGTKTVSQCLKEAFNGTDVNYVFENDYIVLTKNVVAIPQQQGRTITGTVTDNNGEPVIGANVVVKGTTIGTITNFDGYYSLPGVPNGATLSVSYIGYLTREMAVGNQSTVNIILTEDTQALDEVVVVGYGTQRKSDVTGSVAIATADELLRTPSFSAMQGLKGIAPGVNVFVNSGQPGGKNRVVIRGVSTINASSDPLYVVDGVAMEDFQFLNPHDIERMEVLKDASAAAIYGARGANGVILVTTKRGLKGDGVSISYSGYVSMNTLGRRMETMNSAEFMETMRISLDNAVKYGGKSQSEVDQKWADMLSNTQLFDSSGNPLYDTDWIGEATRNSISHNHQLSIQQGGKNSSVGAFLNFTDQEGLLRNTYMKRLNAKLTYDAKPLDWLSTSVNLLVNHTWQNMAAEEGGGQEARRTMIEMPPIFPVKYADGSWSNSTNGVAGFGFEAMANPVHILEDRQSMIYRTQIFGNAALTFHLAPGLDLKTQFGVDGQIRRWRNYTPFGMVNLDSSGQGEANVTFHDILYWQEETFLNYNNTFGKHRINGVLGLSWQERTYRRNYARTRGFFDNYFGFDRMQAGSNVSSPESSYEDWSLNSYFLRAGYTYNDRYMATLTARVDGSSKFGADNKYAFFPAAGLGWMVSNEDFMADVYWIDQFKLHTSYGMTGNSEIPIYRSLSTVEANTILINGNRETVTHSTRLANPNLKWEKTAQWDIGFNLNMFKNRLNFDLSYYYKKTTDLLLERPLPNSTGYSNVMDNIGELSNRGLDIMVSSTNIQTNDFQWTTTLSANYNKGKIDKLGETDADILVDPNFLNGRPILRVGESPFSYFGFRRLGIYTEEEAAELGVRAGTAKRSENREILGKTTPDWTGSFINRFAYKNLDLTVDFQFTLGVDVVQNFYHSAEDRFGLTSGLKTILTDAWSPSNPNTMVQAIRNGTFDGQDSQADSHWVVDGSYLRANLIQLGYTFSPKALKAIRLSSLRAYFSVENAFVITSKDFQGFDPEATSYGNQFSQGIFFFQYPKPTVFTIGANITF